MAIFSLEEFTINEIKLARIIGEHEKMLNIYLVYFIAIKESSHPETSGFQIP